MDTKAKETSFTLKFNKYFRSLRFVYFSLVKTKF
jgi:hypothetical protein